MKIWRAAGLVGIASLAYVAPELLDGNLLVGLLGFCVGLAGLATYARWRLQDARFMAALPAGIAAMLVALVTYVTVLQELGVGYRHGIFLQFLISGLAVEAVSRTPHAAVAVLVVLLAGCTQLTPQDALAPSAPAALDYTFPDGANRTYVTGLVPTMATDLTRLYLRGGQGPRDDVVVFDLASHHYKEGAAPGSAYGVAATWDTSGTLFLEADAGVRVLEEQNFSFHLLPDAVPDFGVEGAVLLHGTPYALLSNPFGERRLIQVRDHHVKTVPLDVTLTHGLQGAALGTDGDTLAVCQRRLPDQALEATILQDSRAYVLDSNGYAASSCVASQHGAYQFAWRPGWGAFKIAHLTSSVTVESTGIEARPVGIWQGNATYVLALDDAANWLLAIGYHGTWTTCPISLDERDNVMLYQDQESVWAYSLPYTDKPEWRLSGTHLDAKCPSLPLGRSA